MADGIAGVSIKRLIALCLSVAAAAMLIYDSQNIRGAENLFFIMAAIYAILVVVLGCMNKGIDGPGLLAIEGFLGMKGVLLAVPYLLNARDEGTILTIAHICLLAFSAVYLLYLTVLGN